MGRTTTWTCDGCDKEITSPSMPPTWSAITVQTEGKMHKTDDSYGKFDLCGDCRAELLNRVNPRYWPRPAKAGEA